MTSPPFPGKRPVLKECGWPEANGSGHCGELVTVVYLVHAADIPLITADDETHPMALGLCVEHDPNHVDAVAT